MCLGAGMVAAAPAFAGPEQDLARVGRVLAEVEDQLLQMRRSLRSEQVQGPRRVEERLIDAELLFNMQDYERASLLYLDIVENHSNHPAFPEALFRLAEAQYQARNYYGARTRFREVLQRANQPGFRGYMQDALGRLIEIAIKTGDFEGIDGHFARLHQMPPSSVRASTHYARGRFLYHQENYGEAARAFAMVGEGSAEHLKALYHQGVVAVVQQQYEPAMELFVRVGRAEPQTNEDRQVVDLAHIAHGALRLEMDQPEEAIRAYQNVNRNSRFFARALFEAASAFSRMGDATRAERALEVLTVAAPDSRYIPRAKILRGNLLLDTGRYEEAREVFHDVVNQFQPVRQQLQEVLAEQQDPAAYFQELVRANMEVFDINSFLPEMAVQWVRQEGDFARAMETLARTSACTRLLGETQRLLQRLDAAVNGPSAINIFAGLRGSAGRAVQIQNRLAHLRADLMVVESAVAGSAGSGLSEARRERQRLEESIRQLPTDQEAYEEAEDSARTGYRRLAADLARINGRVDRLQAMLVALEVYVRDTHSNTGEDDEEAPEVSAEGLAAVHQEIKVHRDAIDTYRNEIVDLRTLVESGQIQVGVGDTRSHRNAQLRDQYADAVRRERAILVASGGGDTMRRAEGLFRRIDAISQQLQQLQGELVQRAQTQSVDLRAQLDSERANVQRYEQELAQLEGEAEEVIGHSAYQNFQQVHDRFYDLVRQGDVGIIDVAWAEREEHRHRIDYLSQESRRQLQALDDEFNEVFDEPETDQE
jgi:TolA-binding protein